MQVQTRPVRHNSAANRFASVDLPLPGSPNSNIRLLLAPILSMIARGDCSVFKSSIEYKIRYTGDQDICKRLSGIVIGIPILDESYQYQTILVA